MKQIKIPLQVHWKAKKDKVSQAQAKFLWITDKYFATIFGLGDNYDYQNRIFDAQLKLLNINGNRIS